MTRTRLKNCIFSITPNPALDLGGIVTSLIPNEKSYVSNETRAPGGNAINSARILARLGAPVVLSGFMGGSTGEEVLSLLKAEKLRCEFVKIQGSTRINVTVSNQSNCEQTRLSFPGPLVHRNEKKQLFELFEKKRQVSLLLVGGSLPKGFGPADVKRLIKLCHLKGIKPVVDCPGEILSQVLEARPFFIKPNLEEFQELTNSQARTIGSVIEKGKKILKQVETLCVSSVEGGTLLMTQKNIYFGRIPKMKIQSTVGAGDSMVGAMMGRYFAGDASEQNILRWGLGAAAATLATTGTALGERADILRLARRSHVEILS